MKNDHQHYNTKVAFDREGLTDLLSDVLDRRTVTVGAVRFIWADLSDAARMEVLKSLIWTAPDAHAFHLRAQKLLNSNTFQETLD